MSKPEQRKTPPSVAEVEDTLTSMRSELAEVEAEAAEAEARMNAAALVGATQRIQALQRFIARLEGQLSEAQEAQARQQAETRLVGIKRAHGSLVASLDDDEARVREAVAALTEAVRRMNDRYAHLVRLRQEAGALADRFSLDAPELPRVMPPAQRGLRTTPAIALSDYLRPKPTTEKDEHGLRERRTYYEIEGTDGHHIIEAVGPRPWGALTKQQEQLVERRARQREEEQREAKRMGQAVDSMQRALRAVPGSVAGATGLL